VLYRIPALHHDRNTVDWTRWRHKITAQRAPAPSSCIGPHTQVLHWAPHLLGPALPTLVIKCMKTEVFYCKSDMYVRPTRFSILCTPTDSSDKTQLIYSTILLYLFASKYDINGSRLNYSTMSSNKFKYINM